MPPMDFYPLDSLQPKELRSELRQLNCKLCYELLEFDPEVEVAIRYAIGNTVVAESLAAARKLAYEDKIREKIVTLDGEEIAQVQKNIQDIEIVIQEIDVRIRSVVAGDG